MQNRLRAVVRSSADWAFSRPSHYALLLLLLPVCGKAETASGGPQHTYSSTIRFDIQRIPFSRFGSYLSISDTAKFQLPHRQQGIYLRTLHHGGVSAFRIELLQSGRPIAVAVEATPTLLTLVGAEGFVKISYQGQDRLRIQGSGVELRFTAEEGWAVPYPKQRWEINTSASKYMFSSFSGTVHETQTSRAAGGRVPSLSFLGDRNTNIFNAEIDSYTSAWRPHDVDGTFEQVQESERNAYVEWLKAMPQVEEKLGTGADLAAYVNWESTVDKSGNLKRPAMLMSKNWMGSLWSWDHTFNAMALIPGKSALAWDQFMLPMDVQDKEGSFPDKWDADSVAWEFSKPPVHGWALAWMLRHGAVSDSQHLTAIYEPLARWTDWYLQYRDSNANGIPEYRHGNESGWDNSTVFLDGGPTESPDLSAYLVLQMQTLSELAKQLGRPEESKSWQERSNKLLKVMLSRFWEGHEFVAFRVIDGRVIHSDSLLLVMPIILGHQLPELVQRGLISDIEKRMAQSPYGLPSEPPTSRSYQADGYWRGPIWAPSTMIIAEGLDDMGRHDLANALRERFCLMAQRSGMAENFDAKSGAGLRDPAYTWTSSVYLIFASQLAHEHIVPASPLK